MKKAALIFAIMLMFCSANSFAQTNADKSKEKIKPALLVIDIQNVYLPMVPDRDKEIGLYYINALIELFRKNGFPVIRIYHYDKENGPAQDSKEFEFPENVNIKPEDTKVVKTYGDGFNKTDLDKVLKDKGCNTLFLCGLSAVGCVLSTWIGAQNHDYTAFMIKNAIMSHNTEYTHHVEEMFDAVSYDVVKLMVEKAAK